MNTTKLGLTMFISLMLVIVYLRNIHKEKELVIDLPEEISIATEQDTLIGFIRDDTLFIEFNHKY